MYTEDDVKRLFSIYGTISIDLSSSKTSNFHHPADTPCDILDRIEKLERQLMIPDSVFSVLTKDETFVVRLHLLDGLSWPQIAKNILMNGSRRRNVLCVHFRWISLKH